MATTEERVRKLIDENLEIEGREANSPVDMGLNFADAGVASAQVVAFAKLVADEFNITIAPEDFANFANVGDLIGYIDSKAA